MERVYLAKGSCAGCGRPVARRAPTSGQVAVTCNVCGAATQLRAQLHLRDAGKLEPAPVRPTSTSFVAVRAGKGLAPGQAAPYRSEHAWRGPAFIVVLVAGFGAALWSAWTASDEPATWSVLTERIVVESTPGGARFSFETRATDVHGAPRPLDGVPLPEWHAAVVETLVEPGDAAWRSCSTSLSCVVHAPSGSLVMLTRDVSTHVGAVAIDVDSRQVWERAGTWRPVGPAALVTSLVNAGSVTEERA